MPIWALIIALLICELLLSLRIVVDMAFCSACIRDTDRNDPSCDESADWFEVSNVDVQVAALLLIPLLSSVITELIVGFMAPGRPLAMMIFKVRLSLSQRLLSMTHFPPDLWVHHYVASDAIHRRFQTGPLHENPTTSDVLVPSRFHHHCWHCPAGRSVLVCLTSSCFCLRIAVF
jgi:hypothetical protein